VLFLITVYGGGNVERAQPLAAASRFLVARVGAKTANQRTVEVGTLEGGHPTPSERNLRGKLSGGKFFYFFPL
jgi:hypothetical protein